MILNCKEVQLDSRLGVGDTVIHFKHEQSNFDEVYQSYYKIKDIGIDATNGNRVVIYQAYIGADIYVRPYDEFMSEVDHVKYPCIKQKYRYELVGKDLSFQNLKRQNKYITGIV